MASVELARLAAGWAESASADLEGLLGCQVSLAPGAPRRAARDALLQGLRGEGATVAALLRARDEPRSPVHLVTGATTAHALASARLGLTGEEETTGPDINGEALAAFVESVELCGGILGRLLSELGELPGLEYASCATLPEPLPEDAALAAGDHRGQPFALELAGRPCGQLLLLFPETLAEAWFGPAGEAARTLPLAVIDPDPERREQAEALAEPLGCPVWTLDPAELGPHSFDELSETDGVIVAWDLGGVPGLDLLDDLRGDPRTVAVPVALALPAPTRDRVLMALRWGATTVLQQPLDAEEVGRRLARR